ncbi:hypothetical protein D3C75_853460 [compost metagenome]
MKEENLYLSYLMALSLEGEKFNFSREYGQEDEIDMLIQGRQEKIWCIIVYKDYFEIQVNEDLEFTKEVKNRMNELKKFNLTYEKTDQCFECSFYVVKGEYINLFEGLSYLMQELS